MLVYVWWCLRRVCLSEIVETVLVAGAGVHARLVELAAALLVTAAAARSALMLTRTVRPAALLRSWLAIRHELELRLVNYDPSYVRCAVHAVGQ